MKGKKKIPAAFQLAFFLLFFFFLLTAITRLDSAVVDPFN